MKYVNNLAFVKKFLRLYVLLKDFLDHYPSGRLNKKKFTEYYQRLHPNIGPQSSFE